MCSRALLPAFAVLLLAPQIQAQDFEVASVKRLPALTANEATLRRQMSGTDPGGADMGRIRYAASTLRTLLVRAYGLESYQISGPSWLDAEFYEIEAKPAHGATKEQVSVMLQRLLTQRFGIEFHRERRRMRVYALTVAKGGAKLKPAGHSADSAEAQRVRATTRAARLAQRRADVAAGRPLTRSTSSATVADLAQQLSRSLNALVIDQTRIEGNYEIEVIWAPDDTRATPDGSTGDLPSRPSLSAALQEQLGLKLEPGEAPIEVLVIDKAEKTPTEN